MAQDSGSKTEKPTSKRLGDARRRGQVVKSVDLNSAIVLSGAMMLIGFMGPYTFVNLYAMAKQAFAHLATQPLTQTVFIEIFTSTITTIALLVLPFFIGTMTIGILINLVQVKPLFTVHPLMPKLDKINPINGFKRFLSVRSFVEAGKGLIKMAIMGMCGFYIVQGNFTKILTLQNSDVYTAMGFIVGIISQIGVWVCIIYFVLGLVDWWYQRYEFEKGLRMSKQEVKQERKDEEVDPHLKGRIRQMGAQLVRKRQLAAVPKADVVITNPTHFAIAIQYDPDIAPAPRVVAKGQDHFALKIREVAKENGVPMVENKPLARTLYATVDVDRMIPPELFLAVAEVLAFVFSKNKGRRMKPRRPTE